MRKAGTLSLAILFIGLSGFAQEYDDLYFNSSDREKLKKEKTEEYLEFEYPSDYEFSDNYSTYNTPEESIEKYEEQAAQNRLQYQSPYNSTNPVLENKDNDNPLNFQYSATQEAYDQGYQDGMAASSPIVNNYYGNNMGGLGWNGFNDPWMGWGNGWGLSVGWGWNSWGWDPWFNNGWGWGWNRPLGMWGNPWGGYFCPSPFYDWGGWYFAANTPSKVQGRALNRGPRAGRGSDVASGSSRGRNSSRVTVAESRDFSRLQNRYSDRSRNGVGQSRTQLGTSRNNDLNRSGNRTYTRRINDNGSGNRNVNGADYQRNRTYNRNSQGNSTYNRNYNGNTNRTYNRNNSGNNRSYNRNSNTNRNKNSNYSRGSSNRKSNINRSGSSRNRSFKSSGSSGSRRSGSMRSSSGSSSRSSGGSRSRGSSGRRGN